MPTIHIHAPFVNRFSSLPFVHTQWKTDQKKKLNITFNWNFSLYFLFAHIIQLFVHSIDLRFDFMCVFAYWLFFSLQQNRKKPPLSKIKSIISHWNCFHNFFSKFVKWKSVFVAFLWKWIFLRKTHRKQSKKSTST